MTFRRETSADSAARFLKSRTVNALRRRKGRRPKGEIPGVPEAWQFVEKRKPGAYAAWLAWPNARAADFVLGTSGKPEIGVAVGKGLYSKEHPERRYLVFRGEKWEVRK